MKRLASLTTFVLLSACSLAPDYTPPDVKSPVAYKETGAWRVAAPADTQPKGSWWTAFGDEALNDLESRIIQDNQTFKAGAARLVQAHSAVRQARAGLFPQIGGSASAARSRRSQTTTPKITPPEYTDDKVSLSISYEVDLWGRIGNAIEAANDEYSASAQDLSALELALRTELAVDYFSLRGADASIRILKQTIETDQSALDLVIRRHDGGIAAQADVAQAQAQLELAKTQLAEVSLKRAQLEHAIAVLMGMAPADFQVPENPLAGDPPPFAPGLPSTLLERRPDVAAAERRMAAANARIGIARAAWFPVFDLGALIGLGTGSPGSLLQASSAIWALGPGTLTQTIFDGGRIKGQNEQAQAVFDETVANYRQTTLNAWLEVEDQLAALRHLEDESQTQTKAIAAEREALTQARYRYQAGIVTYLEVIVNQNALLSAELADSDIRLRRLTADILLVKGLGGGWERSPPE